MVKVLTLSEKLRSGWMERNLFPELNIVGISAYTKCCFQIVFVLILSHETVFFTVSQQKEGHLTPPPPSSFCTIDQWWKSIRYIHVSDVY